MAAMLKGAHYRTPGVGLYFDGHLGSQESTGPVETSVCEIKAAGPYKFIGLGAIDVAKPYEFPWFGDIDGP